MIALGIVIPFILEFTFHYGPIQIAMANIELPTLADLHSTMVLFKYKSSILLTSDASRFTFHYGPIQM